MRKNKLSPALLLSAAAVLFACAFFLGRATLREPFLETQRAAQGTAPRAWIDSAAKTAEAAAGTQRVCLNCAELDELLSLPGVGEATAARILAYRDKYGKFVTVEQLTDVDGIGEGLLERLRPYIFVEEYE